MFRCLGFLLLENDCQASFSFQLSSLLKQRHSCHGKRSSAMCTVTQPERLHISPSRACTYPPAALAACRLLSEAGVLGYMLLQSLLGWLVVSLVLGRIQRSPATAGSKLQGGRRCFCLFLENMLSSVFFSISLQKQTKKKITKKNKANPTGTINLMQASWIAFTPAYVYSG